MPNLRSPYCTDSARATVDLPPPVPPPIQILGFEIALAWHERNHHDAAQRWFRDQIVAVAAGE